MDMRNTEAASAVHVEQYETAVRQTSALEKVIEELDRETFALVDEVTAIARLLDPVSQPVPETVEVDRRGSDPEPPRSQMFYRVREAATRVREQRERLSTLRVYTDLST